MIAAGPAPAKRFILVGVVGAVLLGAIFFADDAQGARPGCDTRYTNNYFHVCFFSGVDPGTGEYLGTEKEPKLGRPAPDRTYAINRDWGSGPIFDGIHAEISGVWRGRFNFIGGRYQFTVFTSDGVRMYVDEQLVLDEWETSEDVFAVALELEKGYHKFRIEWFEGNRTWWSAVLRVHWDKGPTVVDAKTSPVVIDVFMLTRQDVCIAGDPWTSGDPLNIYNADRTVYKSWQIENAQNLPRALKPSDASLATYPQVECFSFGLRPEEIAYARDEVSKFAASIEEWTFGAIQPTVEITELEGEFTLSRIGGAFWVSWWDIEDAAEPYMTKDSDFAINLTSIHDIDTGRFYGIPFCGGTYGFDFGLSGAGYSWVANSVNPGWWFQCLTDSVILHEWGNQMDSVLHDLMGLPILYPPYPPCGEGDPDTFKWFPASHHWDLDPDSPWCGGPVNPGNRGITAHQLLHHFDPSLSHYALPYLTGNHCDNGEQDYGESSVDSGGNCPPT